jgi:hypothetical protein
MRPRLGAPVVCYLHRAICVLTASRGLSYVPFDVFGVGVASSSFDSSLTLSACASLATSLNWSSRLVWRMNLVAAVAPVVEFSMTRISDVRSPPRRPVKDIRIKKRMNYKDAHGHHQERSAFQLFSRSKFFQRSLFLNGLWPTSVF